MFKRYNKCYMETGDKVDNNKSKSELPFRQQSFTNNLHTQKGAANWLVLLLIIIIMAGAGGGYYVWMETQKEIGQLHTYVEKVESTLKSKVQSVDEFQSKLSKVSAEIKSQDLVLNDHLKELQSQMAKLDGDFRQVSDATLANETWLLSEAEYLLKTADHRILMKEDVAGAIRIMKSVDLLLKKMPVEDKQLLKVRVALANDIASLQALKDIDVLGTYAQLTALGDQIERLPLVPMEMPATTEDEKKSQQPKILAKINDTFEGYLSINRHDKEAIQALLSEESAYALKSSFRLIIEQAQTALLRGDQIMYDNSLSKLRSRVHQYFVADNFKVNMVIKKIDDLLKVKVSNDLPDISGSQQELKRYLSKRAQQLNKG